MEKGQIQADKITKPIQLLAVWFVGLIIVDGCFLWSALQIGPGQWEYSALIIAAIVNVPLFLGALFLLQTRFRPELQEDVYYSRYLEKKTGNIVTLTARDLEDSRFLELRTEIAKLGTIFTESNQRSDHEGGDDQAVAIPWRWTVAINDHLQQFHEIRRELKKHKIPVTSIFGKVNGSPRPKEQVIGFRRDMPYEPVVQLLRILREFDFFGYMYTDDPREVDPEDIYIGTYGFENEDVIPLTNELWQLFETDIEEIDLRHFERRVLPPNPD